VSLEDVANGRVGDVISDVGQRALHTIVTPARILLGEIDHEVDDHLPQARPTGFSFLRRVPFLGHSLAMPTENHVGCEPRSEFLKSLAAEDLSFHRQPSPLIVVEQDAFVTELLFQLSILGAKILGRFLLLTILASRQDEEVELPRLQYKFHGEVVRW